MKIYDCFMFFKEFEVLELRFEELYDKVDFFVLTESNKTHSMKDKPLYFKENASRFAKYFPKIIYVENLDNNSYSHHWAKENNDRNTLMRGLVDANPEDIIMVSDVDEIPDLGVLDLSKIEEPTTCDMEYYYYHINCRKNREWPGTTIHKMNMGFTPQYLRDNRTHLKRVPSGWHYSYMGGFERVKEKLIHNPDSIEYRHFEYLSESYNGEKIRERIENAEDIFGRQGDQTLRIVDPFEGRKPACLKALAQKYPNLIK